ncbi:26S proteasome regulatory subunit N9 [Cladophialophora yegresii CBS 114405]|uniref:26S proteasome regulatory subunit N9 n=1 Tax=Cladophialophora yegresii CBS 114405 TaxID=1182544 RepID=W9W531_9EURO|nr:26S proteasome regulatory subunit N9 [Cladophialophora yegresii CBS 114405]EXJ60105.1 26S proteasome regulatory subunit N9 [Cladophialophora yegresii CBS 114405]
MSKHDPEAISNFLADQRDEAPDALQHIFITFEDLWDRKLWHQLTDNLLEYFKDPASEKQRLPIYNTFIISFADKINQLKLVKLALGASAQIQDDTERSRFLKTLAARVDKPDSEEAHVYAITELASVYLRLAERTKAREQLDNAQKTLDQFDFVENVVHAAFYRVNADYFQAENDYTSYYRNSLLYLACIDESKDLTEKERQKRAYNLAIAALVSDQIYNFGELLLHPILSALSNNYAWLRELLFAFNRGDLATFDRMSNNLNNDETLESHREFLWQKINLAALTELVFKRPPHDRAMTFKTISQETKVKPDEIEHLIMKALSLGLVRGKIDQVAEVARINWVQPKVLERSQIEGMLDRLKEWGGNVNDLGHWIEGVGKDVWAS